MAEMKDREINAWWKSAFRKADLRQSNKSAAPKGNRWSTHNDIRDFAPAPKTGKRK